MNGEILDLDAARARHALRTEALVESANGDHLGALRGILVAAPLGAAVWATALWLVLS